MFFFFFFLVFEASGLCFFLGQSWTPFFFTWYHTVRSETGGLAPVNHTCCFMHAQSKQIREKQMATVIASSKEIALVTMTYILKPEEETLMSV